MSNFGQFDKKMSFKKAVELGVNRHGVIHAKEMGVPMKQPKGLRDSDF